MSKREELLPNWTAQYKKGMFNKKKCSTIDFNRLLNGQLPLHIGIKSDRVAALVGLIGGTCEGS